jgi:hypothetical protein
MIEATETQTAQPILHTGVNETDSSIVVDIYDRSDMRHKGTTLRKALADNHGVHDHLSANNPHNSNILQYRDTGVWRKYRGEHGVLEIVFTVGCTCSGDCCGCMCGKSLTVQQTESHFIVISKSSYNY